MVHPSTGANRHSWSPVKDGPVDGICSYRLRPSGTLVTPAGPDPDTLGDGRYGRLASCPRRGPRRHRHSRRALDGDLRRRGRGRACARASADRCSTVRGVAPASARRGGPVPAPSLRRPAPAAWRRPAHGPRHRRAPPHVRSLPRTPRRGRRGSACLPDQSASAWSERPGTTRRLERFRGRGSLHRVAEARPGVLLVIHAPGPPASP